MDTTEFNHFLDVELTGATPPEIFELYSVVKGAKGSGTFSAVQEGDSVIVTGPGMTLHLRSAKAVQAFISHLSRVYMRGLPADEWYGLAMAQES